MPIMTTYTSKQYSELRSSLQTGDIILFSSKGFFSSVIRFGTKSQWSHVGMVIRADDLDVVALWESTTQSKAHDLKAGTPMSGVQIVSLSTRIRQTLEDGGYCVVRHLVGSGTQSTKQLMDSKRQELSQFRREFHGKPYEESAKELLKAAVDWGGDRLFGNKEDLSSIFCSELVAETYQMLGLLDEETPSNEYVPADFSSERKLNLKMDFELQPEIRITLD